MRLQLCKCLLHTAQLQHAGTTVCSLYLKTIDFVGHQTEMASNGVAVVGAACGMLDLPRCAPCAPAQLCLYSFA